MPAAPAESAPEPARDESVESAPHNAAERTPRATALADSLTDVAGTRQVPTISGTWKSIRGTRPTPASGPLPARSIGGPAAARVERADHPASAARPATPARFFVAARRGNTRILLRAAIGHGVVALALAVSASALVVTEQPLGQWMLGLAALVAIGAGVAYLLVLRRRAARVAALALVAAQLGALAWGLALVGPRVAFLLFLPPAIWLALRMGGRRAALISAVGGAAVYLCVLGAAGLGLLTARFSVDAMGQALLDMSAAALGLALTLASIIGAAGARERSEAAARARLYELRLARAEVARQRDRMEADGEQLDEALACALRGRGIEPIAAEGALSPVAESINDVAERLRTLQKDREDRLRLEGALRSLTRALERAWLGVPWSWPESSGTMLDDLVALLRASRQRENHERAGWSDETPTFINLPPLATPSWPTPLPDNAGSLRVDVTAPRSGWDELLGQ
jgi:hypothetical protein